MAKLEMKPTVELRVVFSVSEQEARALDALAGYGDDAFIQNFYEKLGKAYMRDHESGLRTFINTIREIMPAILSRTNDARRVFDGSMVATYPEQKKGAE